MCIVSVVFVLIPQNRWNTVGFSPVDNWSALLDRDRPRLMHRA